MIKEKYKILSYFVDKFPLLVYNGLVNHLYTIEGNINPNPINIILWEIEL